MRHGRKVKKLGRTRSHRKAMLANMAASLFMYHIIKTTEAKAKEVKRLAERLITLGKKGDLHAHRKVYDVIRDRKLVKKIFDEIAPKFKDREGGYARVVRVGTRRGDGTTMSVVELLMEKPPKEEKKGKKQEGGRKAKPEKAPEAKAKPAKKGKRKADIARAKGAQEEKVQERQAGEKGEADSAGSQSKKAKGPSK